MDDADHEADLRAQNSVLKAENQALLHELEEAYGQLRLHLESVERERDIAYQALRERNRDLQDRLGDLVKTHEELQQTQQMLVRSERLAAMGEMAAAIVHEIKTPLTAIVGFLDLARHVNAPLSLEGVNKMFDQATYLNELSNNILGFVRHHQGQTRRIDLNALVVELETFVSPLFKKVKIELDLNPRIPPVLADPGKVKQVVLNLVLNALDAMGEKGRVCVKTGQGSIGCAIEQVAEGSQKLAVEMDDEVLKDDFVFVAVQDDGPGIGEANLERIFEAFFTTKEAGKGTGLGLSIARTIAEEWGGNILVDSQVSEGACFRVFLPVSLADSN